MPKYQSIEVRKGMQNRVNEIQSAEANPVAWGAIRDKAKILEEKQKLEKTLSEITPPDVDGATRDKLRGRLNQLLPAYQNGIPGIVPPKPTEAQMWNAKAGDVGQHRAHESFWLHHTLDSKGKVIEQRGRGAEDEIKDIQRTLNKEAEGEDPDAASTEVFRDMSSTVPLADAVRRSYGLSDAAKANYEQVFPDHKPTPIEEKVESAEVARLAKEVEELKAQLASQTQSKSRRSIVSKAASERMKARWAARKAAQAEPQPA